MFQRLQWHTPTKKSEVTPIPGKVTYNISTTLTILNSNLSSFFFSLITKMPCKSVSTNEPPHDKTNKITLRPAKTQISLGIRPFGSESSMCAQLVSKDLSFLHADSEDSDQTGLMPRLICVFAGRSHFVMRRLKLSLFSCDKSSVFVSFCDVSLW